jgi:hypothetical protein
MISKADEKSLGSVQGRVHGGGRIIMLFNEPGFTKYIQIKNKAELYKLYCHVLCV